MTKMELVEQALKERGDASPANLAAFIRTTYAVSIEAPLVAVIKATLLHKELLGRYREETRKALAAPPGA